ncbi:MAG: hypothetical protein KF696_10520 [Planctomycetes bacterium]|nr:hypothetical protein [Planctomycetota bacterium]MCW8135136.1 hypothetical protein [Planctomycetota bacterium]
MKTGLRVKVACVALAACVLLLACAPALADSRDEWSRPVSEAQPAANTPANESELRKQLEAEYRVELEKRLEQERSSYSASLTSLWIANSAVWAILLLFVIMQALSARKKSAELDRIKQQRGN